MHLLNQCLNEKKERKKNGNIWHKGLFWLAGAFSLFLWPVHGDLLLPSKVLLSPQIPRSHSLSNQHLAHPPRPLSIPLSCSLMPPGITAYQGKWKTQWWWERKTPWVGFSRPQIHNSPPTWPWPSPLPWPNGRFFMYKLENGATCVSLEGYIKAL